MIRADEIAERVGGLAVDHEIVPLQILDEDDGGRVVEERLQLVLRLAQAIALGGDLGLRQPLGGDVAIHEHHVADAPFPIEQREPGALDGAAPRDAGARQRLLGRVVPDRRQDEELAGEGAPRGLEDGGALDERIGEQVVLGRRLDAEDLAERPVGEQALPRRQIDLEPDRRVGEEPDEQRHRIVDAGEALPNLIRDRVEHTKM